ncbi:39S ribosomal protein L51, mitochondrial [Intoshia linei]|uniref:39S ribosomal protein L51, mitochondrial n=1 Tax=Intoshia linei TaxID=1819745 RepID=A0A177B1Y7_9BILA|nr:39S ribosomal protein L51, mitochondrial [Intoshia linei]
MQSPVSNLSNKLPDKAILKGINCYLDIRSNDNKTSQRDTIARAVVKLGGKVSYRYNKNVTHVIIKNGNDKTKKIVKDHPGIYCTNVKWIDACIKNNKRMNEFRYYGDIEFSGTNDSLKSMRNLRNVRKFKHDEITDEIETYDTFPIGTYQRHKMKVLNEKSYTPDYIVNVAKRLNIQLSNTPITDISMQSCDEFINTKSPTFNKSQSNENLNDTTNSSLKKSKRRKLFMPPRSLFSEQRNMQKIDKFVENEDIFDDIESTPTFENTLSISKIFNDEDDSYLIDNEISNHVDESDGNTVVPKYENGIEMIMNSINDENKIENVKNYDHSIIGNEPRNSCNIKFKNDSCLKAHCAGNGVKTNNHFDNESERGSIFNYDEEDKMIIKNEKKNVSKSRCYFNDNEKCSKLDTLKTGCEIEFINNNGINEKSVFEISKISTNIKKSDKSIKIKSGRNQYRRFCNIEPKNYQLKSKRCVNKNKASIKKKVDCEHDTETGGISNCENQTFSENDGTIDIVNKISIARTQPRRSCNMTRKNYAFKAKKNPNTTSIMNNVSNHLDPNIYLNINENVCGTEKDVKINNKNDDTIDVDNKMSVFKNKKNSTSRAQPRRSCNMISKNNVTKRKLNINLSDQNGSPVLNKKHDGILNCSIYSPFLIDKDKKPNDRKSLIDAIDDLKCSMSHCDENNGKFSPLLKNRFKNKRKTGYIFSKIEKISEQDEKNVIFTSFHKPKLLMLKHKIMSNLENVSFSENFDLNKTTHIICASDSRTINFVFGVIYGLWIVSDRWILDSIKQSKFCDENLYSFDDVYPVLKKTRNDKNYLNNLFSNVGSMYLFIDSKHVKDSFNLILKKCGGKISNNRVRADICIGKYCQKSKFSVITKWIVDCIMYAKVLSMDQYKSSPIRAASPIAMKIFSMNILKGINIVQFNSKNIHKATKYALNLTEEQPYRKRLPYRHGLNYKYHKGAECGFRLTDTKNRLQISKRGDLRLKLTTLVPNINKLCQNRQAGKHWSIPILYIGYLLDAVYCKLPRPTGRLENIPVSGLPDYELKFKDSWTTEKASFGECDYIDILGDGLVQPTDLIDGPEYLIGFKGNKLQKLIRRIQYEGTYLREYKPTLYHSINKQIWYLYKHYNIPRNRRQRDSNEKQTGISRVENIDGFTCAFE